MYPVCTEYVSGSTKGKGSVYFLAGIIQFRLNADYVQRFDALASRLGLNRTQVIRNLLSRDPILIDMIEDKAKTIRQMTIEDVVNNTTELPLKIPIRLNKDYEQRFNDLATSLGINRVQVLRNLLSGDEVLVSGVCKKARVIKITHLQGGGIEQNPFPQQRVSNVPTSHLNVSQETLKPQVGADYITEFCGENEQTPSESKRGRKKKIPSVVDHSEARRQIIEHLNQMTGKNFRFDTKGSIDAIDKMLDVGKPTSEFIKIIDNMVPVWIDNPKMKVRLCPETLFRPVHWEKYLNAEPLMNTVNNPRDVKGIKNKSNKYENFYL